jgi:hypothetical protein
MAGISVGTVSVDVIPNVQRFASTARAKLVPEAEKLGDAMGKAIADRINEKLKGVHDAKIGADTEKANLEIDRLKAKLDELSHKKITPEVDVKGNSLFSKLSGALSGGLSSIPGFGSAGSLAGIAMAIPALDAVLAEVVALGSGLAAAGAGAGAFAVLAKPAFSAVSGALGNINKDQAAYDNALTKTAKNTALKKLKQDWANLDPAERNAVKSVQGLAGEYHKLSSAFEPQAFKVFNGGLQLASTLLPKVTPFASTFANSIDKFETRVDNAAKSKGFQNWLKQFQGIEGPALGAFENGIAKLTPTIGRFFTIFSSKDVVNGINIAFSVINGALQLTANYIDGTRRSWDQLTHAWDTLGPTVGSAILTFFGGVVHATQDFTHTVLNAFGGIVHGADILFGNLPGFGWLKSADKAFTSWRASVDSSFDGAIGDINKWKTTLNNAPKVAKLKGDISDLTTKLNSAKSQLRDPRLSGTQRARLEANINQLTSAIAEARRELDSLNGKTATTYVITRNEKINSVVTQGNGGGSHITGFAAGGSAPPGLHWVGERGPELVNFGRTTRVYNANQSRDIAGKASNALIDTLNVNVAQSGATAGDIIDAAVYKLRGARLAGVYG